MFQSPVYWILLFASAVVFWVLPRAARFGFLALVSFGYLHWLDVDAGEPLVQFNTPVVLLLWTVAFYILGKRIGAKRVGKGVMTGMILGIIAYLAYFKYLPRLAEDFFGPGTPMAAIALPLGISYFTFKLIHYAAEVARGSIPKHSFQHFFCFIFLFPIFTAGPIERFDHFMGGLSDRVRKDDLVFGLTRITHGLIKKFVIAETLLFPVLKRLRGTEHVLEFLDVLPWYKVVAFLCGNLVYAYLDFSAYSDIAIGSSRIFGIRILENFNWPFVAPNIGNFWQRWHMTLAGWCKGYVYMPLMGITRNPWLAVYATFLTMGLWHAGSINWIMWGLYNGTGVMAYLMFTRWRRAGKIRLPEYGPLKYWGIPVTFAFASGMVAFTSVDHADFGPDAPFWVGPYSSLRLLAKCVFIDLPLIGWEP